jgi:hypothetical protein
MGNSEDLSPASGDKAPNNQDGLIATRNDDEDVAQLVRDDETPEEGPAVTLEEPRKILGEALDDGEEMSSVDGTSVDAIPRRAGSPIDSITSGPDDSPSVQVCLLFQFNMNED